MKATTRKTGDVVEQDHIYSQSYPLLPSTDGTGDTYLQQGGLTLLVQAHRTGFSGFVWTAPGIHKNECNFVSGHIQYCMAFFLDQMLVTFFVALYPVLG